MEDHQLEENEAADEVVTNRTDVEMNQNVTSEYVGVTSARFYGVLLKWMDVCACISAERHAKMACVTVSIDNLIFDSTRVKEGDVVQLKSKVNRAFGTSMEVGIQVRIENLQTRKITPLCKAFLTFVARPDGGGKIQLEPVYVRTEEERMEHLLANERRRIRRAASHEIIEVSSGINRTMSEKHFSLAHSSKKGGIPVKKTKAESVELVLPQHANHHKTAFGGQIMEWMVSLAMISASRVCVSATPVPTAVDSVVFRAPAYVGDRVFLQSSVNAVFSTSLEVGVRVEARSISGDIRHINSAFFIFEAIDESGEVNPPKRVCPYSSTEKERSQNAQARYWSRLSRKSMFSKRDSSLVWSKTQALDLALENMQRLTSLKATPDASWKLVSSDNGVICKKFEDSAYVTVCVSSHFDHPADTVFQSLCDFTERPKWDLLCRDSQIVHFESEGDCILQHVLQPSEAGGKPKEVIMLATERKATSPSDYHALAFVSIDFEDMPPSDAYFRAEVVSSGYIVQPNEDCELDKGTCTIHYFHKLSSTVLPYISGDLIGLTNLLQVNTIKLKKYVASQH